MPVVRYFVADVDTAVELYTRYLGFTVEQRRGPAVREPRPRGLPPLAQRPRKLAAASAGGRWAARIRRLEPARPLQVENLTVHVERLKAEGVGVRGDPRAGGGYGIYCDTEARLWFPDAPSSDYS